MAHDLGATGDFPEGKLNADDEGGLKMAVGYDPETKLTRVEFGKPVSWLALPEANALELAKLLIKHSGSSVEGLTADPGVDPDLRYLVTAFQETAGPFPADAVLTAALTIAAMVVSRVAKGNRLNLADRKIFTEDCLKEIRSSVERNFARTPLATDQPLKPN
jgi:hypothetical protein